MAIIGAHTIVYATDADAARAFFRDVLQLPHVDVGGLGTQRWSCTRQRRVPRGIPWPGMLTFESSAATRAVRDVYGAPAIALSEGWGYSELLHEATHL